MRVRVGSRGSALAVLQAKAVGEALQRHDPRLDVEYVTHTSEGDRNRSIALWQATEKGLFTQDLTRLLVEGRVDLVVHSWKDLPVEQSPTTMVAGTLERADSRDVLLARPVVAENRPSTLRVLTSSPRRAWQIERSLAALLPWSIGHIEVAPVRGNIATRLQKLLAGEADALVMAKAALDRLLEAGDA